MASSHLLGLFRLEAHREARIEIGFPQILAPGESAVLVALGQIEIGVFEPAPCRQFEQAQRAIGVGLHAFTAFQENPRGEEGRILIAHVGCAQHEFESALDVLLHAGAADIGAAQIAHRVDLSGIGRCCIELCRFDRDPASTPTPLL